MSSHELPRSPTISPTVAGVLGLLDADLSEREAALCFAWSRMGVVETPSPKESLMVRRVPSRLEPGTPGVPSMAFHGLPPTFHRPSMPFHDLPCQSMPFPMPDTRRACDSSRAAPPA